MLNQSIATTARFTIFQKITLLRREWQCLIENRDPAIKALGSSKLENYRELMLGVVTNYDFLATTVEEIAKPSIDLTMERLELIDELTRWWMLELNIKQRDDLIVHIANVILEWTDSKGLIPETAGERYLEQITNALGLNPGYITLILLRDLHHITFVEKAESCYEILSSILKCY